MVQSFAEALSSVPKSQGLAATLAKAFDYACAQSHRMVTLEHLLLALAEDQDAAAVLNASHVDLNRLAADVSGHLGRLEDRVPPGQPAAPVADGDLVRILDSATAAARQSRRRELNGAIVLAAIVGDGRSTSANILKVQGLTFEAAIRALQRGIAAPEPRRQAPEAAAQPPAPSAEPQLQREPQHAAPAPAPPSAPSVNGGGPQSTDAILASVRRRISATRATQGGAAERAPRQSEVPQVPPAPATAPAPPQPVLPVTAVQTAPPRDPAWGQAPPAGVPPLAGEFAPPISSHPVIADADPGSYDAPHPYPEPAPHGRPDMLSEPPGWAPPPVADPNPAGARPVRMPPPLPALPALPPGGQPMPPPALPGQPSAYAAEVQREAAWPPLQSPAEQAPPGYTAPASAPWPEETIDLPRSQGGAHPGYAPPAPAPGYPPAGAPFPAPVSEPPPRQTALAPRPVAPPAAIAGAALAHGQLIETIPRTMRLGRTSPVEVRIAKAVIREIGAGSDGQSPAYRHDLIVTKAMAVRLRAVDGGCFVEPTSLETQWIDGSGGYMSDDHASWRWTITPRRRGKTRLQLAISVRTVGIDGLTAEMVLPEETIAVTVRGNLQRSAYLAGGWLLAAAAGAGLVLLAPVLLGPLASLISSLIGW